MTSSLRLRLHPSFRGPKLIVVGQLDASNVDLMLQVMASALHIRGATVVLVDLTQVTFIDVAGMTGLLRCRRLARQTGITLQITGVSASVLAAARACHAVTSLGLTQLGAAISCVTGRIEAPKQQMPKARTFCGTRSAPGSQRRQ
jgi:anti-anti-sigma factor